MAPSSRRRNNLLLPLALTAAAGAASYALYYYLSSNSTETPSTPVAHESDSEAARAPASSGPKRKIALVVREGSDASPLLSALPQPLPNNRAHVFILIYSPGVSAHPLSDEGSSVAVEGRVYTQARKMSPNAPRETLLPYTDPRSLEHMLKQIRPDLVFAEGALVAEDDGAVVAQLIKGRWIGGCVVAVEDSATGHRLANAVGDVKGIRVLDTPKVRNEWAERLR
jgi:hypothetical protein